MKLPRGEEFHTKFINRIVRRGKRIGRGMLSLASDFFLRLLVCAQFTEVRLRIARNDEISGCHIDYCLRIT
jgi:hypothetical protein